MPLERSRLPGSAQAERHTASASSTSTRPTSPMSFRRRPGTAPWGKRVCKVDPEHEISALFRTPFVFDPS